jgi:hypothetical protein
VDLPQGQDLPQEQVGSVPKHSRNCRRLPSSESVPTLLQEWVHVPSGPRVPTQTNCRRPPFLVNLTAGGQNSRHGGVRSPRVTESVPTLQNLREYLQPEGQDSPKGACRGVDTPPPPYMPMRRDSQWRRSEVRPGPQKTCA